MYLQSPGKSSYTLANKRAENIIRLVVYKHTLGQHMAQWRAALSLARPASCVPPAGLCFIHVTFFIFIRLKGRLRPNIGFTLRGNMAVFTPSRVRL